MLVLMAVLSQFTPDGEILFLGASISPTLGFLGRQLVLDSNSRMTIIIFYACLGVWTISLYLHQIKTRLVPLGLVFNALLLSAISISPFLYSGLILEIAVIISVLILVERPVGELKGVLRYLINFSIGMVFILLAGWYLAGGEITPINEEQLAQASLILGLGFIFWLAVFPVHTWIPLISEEISPVNSFYVLITLPIAVLILLLKYLNGFSWLRSYPVVYEAFGLFGSIMCITSAIWTLFQKSMRRVAGYLILFSSGLNILAMSLNSSNGFILSAYMFLPRLINFSLLAWTIILLEKRSKSRKLQDLEGSFFENPILTSALLFSLFSIAGMPLSPGFPLMQTLITYASRQNKLSSLLIIISISLLSINFIRWVYFFIKREDDRPLSFEESKIVWFIISFVVFALLNGIFPRIFNLAIGSIVSGYEFLVQ